MTAHRDPATILPSLTLPEDRRAVELWARVASLERENERLRALLDGRLSVSDEHRGLIEEAKKRHHNCDPASSCVPYTCDTCHYCHVSYPCEPARLAEALEQAYTWGIDLAQATAEESRRASEAEFSARLAAAERERDAALEKLERRAALTHPEWMSSAGKAFRERFAHRPDANTFTPLGFFEAGAEWAATAEAALHDLTRAERDKALKREARWREAVTLGPCQCDPPGSGEELCSGGCYLREERDAAREALRKFGQHKLGCGYLNVRAAANYGPDLPCDCGLAAALTAPQEAGQ